MSFAPVQNHKFSEAEKTYFLQHSWGKAAVEENAELFPEAKAEAPSDEGNKPKSKEEIIEYVKSIPADKLEEALKKAELPTDGTEKDQRIRLATHLQED